MANKHKTGQGRSVPRRASRPEPERHTYKGHEIVIARDDPGRRVLVDGEPIRYGRLGEEFYLEEYAYDRDASLLAVIERYIDYRDGVAARREENNQ